MNLAPFAFYYPSNSLRKSIRDGSSGLVSRQRAGVTANITTTAIFELHITACFVRRVLCTDDADVDGNDVDDDDAVADGMESVL